MGLRGVTLSAVCHIEKTLPNWKLYGHECQYSYKDGYLRGVLRLQSDGYTFREICGTNVEIPLAANSICEARAVAEAMLQ